MWDELMQPQFPSLIAKYERRGGSYSLQVIVSDTLSHTLQHLEWPIKTGCKVLIGSASKRALPVWLQLKFVSSFYQHFVVQRKVQKSKKIEENEIIGITNYLDFGFELKTSLEDNNTSDKSQNSTFQVAASWQANKNFLFKGKVGPLSSTLSLAFKSWWKPAFTISFSAIRDHTVGNTSFGFGIRVENLREASYERADPNFVMLTPSKEHIAESVLWKDRKSPFYQSDASVGNFDGLPKELRPLGKFL